MSAKNERAQRLAIELRANLRRRKAQARGTPAVGQPDAPTPKADDADASER